MIKELRDLLFATVNFHYPSCGTPPVVHNDGSSSNYYGYFANRYSEQWVVCIDPAKKTGVLRGGDIGWDMEIEIDHGNVLGDLILADEERRWLNACWLAACGEPMMH